MKIDLGLLALSLIILSTACSGADGASGANGKDGAQGPQGPGVEGGAAASVSAITPASAFLGGSTTVTVSGNATSWTDQAQLDFGPGVTVKSLAVASPTAIVADLDVAFDADIGARDVSITDGGSVLVYKGAFRVEPPTTLDTQGSVAQGSVVLAKIHDLDFARPFDTTQAGDGFFTPITYPNIDVSTGTGIASQLSAVQAYSLNVLLLVDVDTAAGPGKVDVLSGPVGARTSFPNPAAVDVAARTPELLQSAQDKTVSIDKPYASQLFAFTPAAGLRIVEVSATSTNSNANPQAFLLGPSGHFGDALGFGSNVGFATAAGSQLYVIYWDNSGTSGYDATLSTTEMPATGGSETEPNDTSATAHAVNLLPFVIQKATLSDASDQDWFAVTVPAAVIGKRIHVRTFAGDALTDTLVEVFDTDGTTTLGGPSNDTGYHENWYSDPLTAAGTYFVEISASPVFDSAHQSYDAYIRIE